MQAMPYVYWIICKVNNLLGYAERSYHDLLLEGL